MEAASTNTQEKRQRGRPRIMGEELTAAFRTLWPESQTTRNLTNKYYQTRSHRLLQDDARFLWLMESAEKRGDKKEVYRASILSELGRIDNDDALRTMAESVCKAQLKTKIAVALIRRWRLGREPKHGWLSLMVTLEHAVNDYIGTHPREPWDDVERALVGVLEEVREQKGGKEKN